MRSPPPAPARSASGVQGGSGGRGQHYQRLGVNPRLRQRPASRPCRDRRSTDYQHDGIDHRSSGGRHHRRGDGGDVTHCQRHRHHRRRLSAGIVAVATTAPRRVTSATVDHRRRYDSDGIFAVRLCRQRHRHQHHGDTAGDGSTGIYASAIAGDVTVASTGAVSPPPATTATASTSPPMAATRPSPAAPSRTSWRL